MSREIPEEKIQRYIWRMPSGIPSAIAGISLKEFQGNSWRKFTGIPEKRSTESLKEVQKNPWNMAIV